jgi:hypothetical protein
VKALLLLVGRAEPPDHGEHDELAHAVGQVRRRVHPTRQAGEAAEQLGVVVRGAYEVVVDGQVGGQLGRRYAAHGRLLNG